MSRKLTIGYDYLTASFTHDRNRWVLEPMLPPIHIQSKVYELLKDVGIKTRGGFPTARRMAHYDLVTTFARDGLSVALSSVERQGSRIEASGKFFEDKEFEEHCVDISKIDKSGGHFTRLDVRVDCFNYDLKLYKMHQILHEHYEPLNRVCHLMSKGKGKTIYIGADTSDVSLRIYDKAVESGQHGDWFRFELQCRNDACHSVHNAPVGFALSCFAKMQQLLKPLQHPVVVHIGQLARGEKPLKTTQPREKGRFEKWFETSIGPALLKLAKESPHDYDIAKSLILATLESCDLDANKSDNMV